MDIQVDLKELWLIQDVVRQPDKHRIPFSREFMSRVHYGIITLTGMPDSMVYELEADEDELWRMENCVSRFALEGTVNVGQPLLRKVFKALRREQGLNDEPLLPVVVGTEEYLRTL